MGNADRLPDETSFYEQQLQVAKIAASFASLAGGFDNALGLVENLREGRDVPTGLMDWSDVRMALILARDALNAVGIVRPTAEQLHCVLLGGECAVPGARLFNFKGVLRMRAEGHGWGRIASERFQRAAVKRVA